MQPYRIEIEIVADGESAHDLYNAVYRLAFNESDGVVVTNIGMTTVLLAHHLHPA